MGIGLLDIYYSLAKQIKAASLWLILKTMANLISAPRINGGGVGGLEYFIDLQTKCVVFGAHCCKFQLTSEDHLFMIKLAKLLAVVFAVYWLLLAHVSLNFLDAPHLVKHPKMGSIILL